MYLNELRVLNCKHRSDLEPTHVMYLNQNYIQALEALTALEPTHVMYLNSTLKTVEA